VRFGKKKRANRGAIRSAKKSKGSFRKKEEKTQKKAETEELTIIFYIFAFYEPENGFNSLNSTLAYFKILSYARRTWKYPRGRVPRVSIGSSYERMNAIRALY